MRVKILAVILAGVSTALAQAPDVQFRAAQQKETVEGDLTSAIKLYRQVADSKSTPPALAARALVRLGRCYERLAARGSQGLRARSGPVWKGGSGGRSTAAPRHFAQAREQHA